LTRTAKAAAASAAKRTQPTGSAFGARLREARKAQGKTLRDLAKEAGCTASTLSNLERGKIDPTALIDALAAALGRSPGWLAGWE